MSKPPARDPTRHVTANLEQMLGSLDVLPYEPPADAVYGTIPSRLESAGTSIGANDLLIAAPALALECTIVADNEQEFARIPQLRRVNRLRQHCDQC